MYRDKKAGAPGQWSVRAAPNSVRGQLQESGKQMNLRKALIGLISILFFAGTSLAAERGSKDEAKAMADAAATHVAKVGWDRAKVDFMEKSNTEWHRKDLYVFAINTSGINQAHGINDKMVGKNMLGMKDANGREYIKDMVSVANKGSGWVDYAWPHPETNKAEEKSSYLRKLPNSDIFVGVGAYK
jgi:signal transduction histidine kinase